MNKVSKVNTVAIATVFIFLESIFILLVIDSVRIKSETANNIQKQVLEGRKHYV